MKHLYESILDDEEDLLGDQETIIIKWLEDNCFAFDIKKLILNNGIVNYNGSIMIINKDITEIPIKFGNINGYFILQKLSKLKSLKNCPNRVYMDFQCSDCDQITNLIGGPQIVNGDYICKCKNLNSLEGAPKELKEQASFDVSKCKSLKNLKGLERCNYEGVILKVYESGIESFVGCPQRKLAKIVCNKCDKLKTLKGCPKEISGDLVCNNCDKLTNLRGAPEIIGGSLICSSCNELKNFDGPRQVGIQASQNSLGYVSCENCPNLINLDGLEKIGKRVYCHGCKKLQIEQYQKKIKSLTYIKNILTAETPEFGY